MTRISPFGHNAAVNRKRTEFRFDVWPSQPHCCRARYTLSVVHNRLAYNLSLIISVYLSSLPVAYLSDAPRRRLAVTGDSARIQDETSENSAWFFNVLGVTWDLGLTSHPKDN